MNYRQKRHFVLPGIGKVKTILSFSFLFIMLLLSCAVNPKPHNYITIDERGKTPIVEETVVIDDVWPGHPVGFFMMNHGSRQYVAYYNAKRHMIVGMRNLDESEFTLYELPSRLNRAPRFKTPESSTILGWDSHNGIVMALDNKGYVHLSGNMHCNKLTYFRSEKPYDIRTLVQVDQMVGDAENRMTYPIFKTLPNGRIIFHYRDGASGNGREIYNIYDTETRKWSRFLDKPLVDGQGRMNAYLLDPVKSTDGWYHFTWVWRDTGNASTNHDLSYMKTQDMVHWYNAFGDQLKLPLTIDNKSVIIDPIPAKGGIINGSGQVGFDSSGRTVITYHKFDENGFTQAYSARLENNKWVIRKISNWNYRWFFEGHGSLENEVRLGGIKVREDGYLEMTYYNKKHGSGCWLLNDQFRIVGKVLKSKLPDTISRVKSTFPGMELRIIHDKGGSNDKKSSYILRWETLGANRDKRKPRQGKLPEPGKLELFKISKVN
ncbi:MAG: BNR repeat-containing protein [Planctomycetota bacterium]